MKKIALLFSFFIVSQGYSQKPLSQGSINDFARQVYYNYKYGSDFFKASAMRILMQKGYNLSDIAVIMESLSTNKKGREAFLEGLYNQFGGGDNQFLFQQIYSLNISAIHAKEIVNYIVYKYGSKVSEK